MNRFTCCLAMVSFLGSIAPALAQAPVAPKKIPDGVYAVQRDSLKEKEVLPLKDGEVLLVDRHPYLKKDHKEPPRHVIVRAAPDVVLDLAREPEAVREGAEVVRISIKLKADGATALERLTRNQLGKQIAIVLDGEVVTMHKVRDVIKGGDAQITSCAEGAAAFLLEKLKAHHEKK